MLNIVYSDQAESFLEKLTVKENKKIRSKIEQYARNPDSLKNQIKRLINSNYFRLRVGDYRVIFTEDRQITLMYIEKIGNRGSVYRGV